jgi:asparagine N-glycosylation enzyme membrane subunit Stt3
MENKEKEEKSIEERKEKILSYLKEKKTWVIYIILAFILWFGAFIRTRNLDKLQGKFPLSIDDPFIFMRYAEYIVEHGKLMAVDYMRNYPLGYNTGNEAVLLAYVISYIYKIVHVFIQSFTVKMAAIWYPVIFFVLAALFFFLLVRKLFNYKIALLATAFLSVITPFLFRSMAGFSDKEPLAIFFMFAAFYFYVSGFKSRNTRKNVFYGVLAGIFTGLMGMTWGGVGYIQLTIPSFVLGVIILNKFKKKDFLVYISWLVTYFIISTQFIPRYGGVTGYLTSFNSNFTILVLIFALFNYYFNQSSYIKNKVGDKFPLSILSLIAAGIFSFLSILLVFGPYFISAQIPQITKKFFNVGQNRWALTVAENQIPYTVDWINQFGKFYFILFLIGSILLFYDLTKRIENKKYRCGLFLVYAVFIFSFVFSKYKPGSVLDGSTGLSIFMYAGSFILFGAIILGVYLYTFYKDREVYNSFLKFDRTFIFIFIFLILNIIAARSVIRLLFVFAPITAILVSYLIFWIIDYGGSHRENVYKYISWGVVVLILYLTLITSAKSSYAYAINAGTGYSFQWQNSMDWVRENTPEDSVFAHWWDYGYVVQAAGERATVTDPGNAIIYWNHLLGRHLLLAHSSKEALEFLKTHDVDYVLIVSEDIGKYPAYSTIGADENFDRYSFIPTFSVNLQQTQQTRNETVYLFQGGAVLDEDLIYNDVVYPERSAGIGAILVPLRRLENVNESLIAEFSQPSAILLYNGKQISLPLECIYFNGVEYNFDDAVLKGCFRIIPYMEADGRTNLLGGGLYLSEKVRKTLFSQLYLMNKEWEGFEVAYTDESGVPLALYQGRLIGPTKIWKITYPEHIKEKLEYLEKKYPRPELEMTR